MAGLKKRKLIISVSLIFTLSILIVLLPIYQDGCYIALMDILFLNFDKFSIYQLDKFNPQILIMFILIFFVIYHQQISNINENTSFLSMELHKKQKREIIFGIMIESFKDNLLIYIVGVATILLLTISLDFIVLSQFTFISEQLIKILIYFLKFETFITSMTIIIRILNIIKTSYYYTIVSYFIFILLLMIDYVFGTSFITISNTIINELLYSLIMLIGNLVIGVILYRVICSDRKELFND